MILLGKRSPIYSHRYADDDLMVGSVSPLELFLIYHEISSAVDSNDSLASATPKAIVFMIDQYLDIKGKVGAMIQSVINC